MFFFLRSGDAALTRRARTHSRLAAVVLKWSRARKRYERQRLLVEEEALEQAEHECLNDADARARRREREVERREELDTEFVARFAERIREMFPGCPGVLRDAVQTVGLGLALGLPAAFAASQVMRALLSSVLPTAPHVLLLAAVALAAEAVAATFLPAHRASRVGPMDALRE